MERNSRSASPPYGDSPSASQEESDPSATPPHLAYSDSSSSSRDSWAPGPGLLGQEEYVPPEIVAGRSRTPTPPPGRGA